MLVFTPGIVDWSFFFLWVKASAVLVLTWLHHWHGYRRKELHHEQYSRGVSVYLQVIIICAALMVLFVFSVVHKY